VIFKTESFLKDRKCAKKDALRKIKRTRRCKTTNYEKLRVKCGDAAKRGSASGAAAPKILDPAGGEEGQDKAANVSAVHARVMITQNRARVNLAIVIACAPRQAP